MKRQNLRKALMVIFILSLPVTMFYLSPLLTLQGALKGIVTSSLIFIVVSAVIAFFAGRVFCGWICPGGAVQEALFPANDSRVLGEKFNLIKYGIAAVWLMTLVVFFVMAGGILSIKPLYGIEGGFSLGTPKSYLMFYVAMGAMVTLSLLLGRRSFCHYGCMLAPFMILGKWAARKFNTHHFHLVADSSKCIDCKLCTKNCPMSLDVNAMVRLGDMYSSECISCGACVDVCPKKVIFFSFSSPKNVRH
jgi:ferredoxin-type protein NapH